MFELEDKLKATGPGSGVNEGIYSPRATQACYERLADLATNVVRSGFTVIVDGTFHTREQRHLLTKVANRLHVPFRILDFQSDAATLRDRVKIRSSRGGEYSDADLPVLERQLQAIEPLSGGELAKSIVLDARRTADEIASQAVSRLNENERL
jgi:predicted kinase